MTTIPVYRGSDADFEILAENADGSAMDLTDWALDFYTIHPTLVNNLTVAITDAVNGLGTGRLEWNECIPNGRIANFRLRLRKGTQDVTFQEVFFNVS